MCLEGVTSATDLKFMSSLDSLTYRLLEPVSLRYINKVWPLFLIKIMMRSRVAILFFLRSSHEVWRIRARWSQEGCMQQVGSDPTRQCHACAEVRAEGSPGVVTSAVLALRRALHPKRLKLYIYQLVMLQCLYRQLLVITDNSVTNRTVARLTNL